MPAVNSRPTDSGSAGSEPTDSEETGSAPTDSGPTGSGSTDSGSADSEQAEPLPPYQPPYRQSPPHQQSYQQLPPYQQPPHYQPSPYQQPSQYQQVPPYQPHPPYQQPPYQQPPPNPVSGPKRPVAELGVLIGGSAFMLVFGGLAMGLGLFLWTVIVLAGENGFSPEMGPERLVANVLLPGPAVALALAWASYGVLRKLERRVAGLVVFGAVLVAWFVLLLVIAGAALY